MDWTEAEDIKRWQEYTEELHKKDLNDLDNNNGMITQLWPRARHPRVWSQVGLRKHHYEQSHGGDGIPVELFQILKENAVKALHSICQQIWKTQQWPQDWKRSAFISIPNKDNTKECSIFHTIPLISYASKVVLKILQDRFQHEPRTCRCSSWI